MESLSLEVIEMIASLLPLQDAINFSMSCGAARDACRSRISPDSFLLQTFRTPRYLLAAMTDFGCVLSGSRALEYFVPGSASKSSDWDFLVPCVESSTLGMMDALEKCGVKWEDPVDDVMSLVTSLERRGTAVLRMGAVKSVSPALFASQRRPKPTREQKEVYKLLHQYVNNTLWVNGKAWIIVETLPRKSPSLTSSGAPRLSNIVRSRNDDYIVESALVNTHASVYKITSADRKMLLEEGINPRTGRANLASDPLPVDYTLGGTLEHLKLINGYITTKGTRQKVQLFQCHSKDGLPSTPLEFIINTYYATHVQCFISGWSAGHFFYDLARQKIAIDWSLGTINDDGYTRRQCIRKYRERGFRFFVSGNLEQELDDDLNYSVHPAMVSMERLSRREIPTKYQRYARTYRQHQMREVGENGRRVGISSAFNEMCSKRNLGDPLVLPHEGYRALYASVNPGSDQVLLEDPARASQSLQPRLLHTVRRLGDKGTLLARFHRLQKTMWAESICSDCCFHLHNHNTVSSACSKGCFSQNATAIDGDQVRATSRCQWEYYSFRHYQTLCRSLDMFRWRLSKSNFPTHSEDIQLEATEPFLPHMARWHYPPSVSKFGNASIQQPMSMGILAAEQASAGQERGHSRAFRSKTGDVWNPFWCMGSLGPFQKPAVSEPRSWSLRDIFAAGMLANTVPNGDDNNLAGVSVTAVAQACVPWDECGKVRVRNGKRVFLTADNNYVSMSNGSVTNTAGPGSDDGENHVDMEEVTRVESRAELWSYHRYLLTATPGACTNAKCRFHLVNMRPPQI